MSLLVTLGQGLSSLSIDLSPQQQQQLLDYIEILVKWNNAYNLVGTHDEHLIVTHHLLDSLAVLPFIQQSPVLDVGTGAGLPGIPLAIARPDMSFCLIDSNGKKTRFLTQVKHQLNLQNVQVVHDRVEKLQTKHRFNVIISRAVGSVDLMMSLCQPLLAPAGEMMLMKGVIPTEELKAYRANVQVEALQVPGVDGQRHLIIIGSANA